jgi:sterol desaturase/sphingolipid hydroxylase (fatty acid hydroxylase superfamily)
MRELSGPSFADPTGNADFSTTLWIWTFILASVGFVALAVLVFWAMGGLAELGLSGKGVVALTLGFLFTAGLAIGLMALVFFSDSSGRDDETNRAAER